MKKSSHTKTIILLSFIFTSKIVIAGANKCENFHKMNLTSIETRIEYSKIISSEWSNYEEIVDNEVKCILRADHFYKGKYIQNGERIFSHYCNFKNIKFNYISSSLPDDDTRDLPRSEKDKNNNSKNILRHKSSIKYLWQVGECSLDSEKYFENLKISSSVKKLEKNKFLLVSENDKYLTYYANPGYVVKLEKNEKLCKKNKNCDLNIILKKYLSSAILDADGKLHTDEPL